MVESGSARGSKTEDFETDFTVVERDQLSESEPPTSFGPLNMQLWSRLVREAHASDLYLGNSPETWSPLGSTDVSSAGRLAADLHIARDMLASVEAETGEFNGHDEHSDIEVAFVEGMPVIGWREAGVVRAGAALGAHSVIIPIPAGSTGLNLEESAVPAVEIDLAIRNALLGLYSGSKRIERMLIWRLYRGSNSSIVDGTSLVYRGGVRVEYPELDDAAFIVARAALVLGGPRTRSDPFARTRLAMALKEDVGLGFRTVHDSPRINHAMPGDDPVVIAVHGTMGTAIPMARELGNGRYGEGRVLRFEHDTWHSIRDNSDRLADQIERVGPVRVLLVAHSRGGLVARRAADLVRRRSPSIGIRIVTLGTPFAGTELIYAARGGLIGMGAALGALRLLTGGVLDPVSRLTSLLFRKLPPGIDEMRPDSPFYSGDAGRQPDPDLFGVAGDVNAEGDGEVWGVAMSGLHGAARAAFGRNSAANDLVVPVHSAMEGITPGNGLVVASDHFSYFLHDDVQDLLRWLS